MSKVNMDDLKKKVLKYRTEYDMRKALNDLAQGRHVLHVPPDSEDADIVIHDVIEELLEAREKLGGMNGQ